MYQKKRILILGIILVSSLILYTIPASADCTTIIIGKNATADGSVIMSHQEDYAPDDCMILVFHPRREHLSGEIIHFAYEDILQVPSTFAYTSEEMFDPTRLGAPPAAFMNGMNEWGVCMGSNCFRSKEELIPNDTGLIWPEICRLVMERCKTSREAVDLATSLVDRYGFNGFEATSCEFLTFVIADPNEGWFIEMGQKQWVAKRVPDNGAIYYANEAIFETDYDLASEGLIDYAVKRGWYNPASGEKFNFRKVYAPSREECPLCENEYSNRDTNTYRMRRAKELLDPKLGSITVQDLMAVHRDHYEGKDYYETPHNRGKRTICVATTHASQVYHLQSDLPPAFGCVMWNAASSPCLSVYTPIFAGNRGNPPDGWTIGWSSFDSSSAWWRFEQVQRAVAPDTGVDEAFYKANAPKIRAIWDQVEKQEFAEVAELQKTAQRRWRPGSETDVYQLLTDYTNKKLQENFVKAGEILVQYWQRAAF
jgi:dipeptidase